MPRVKRTWRLPVPMRRLIPPSCASGFEDRACTGCLGARFHSAYIDRACDNMAHQRTHDQTASCFPSPAPWPMVDRVPVGCGSAGGRRLMGYDEGKDTTVAEVALA